MSKKHRAYMVPTRRDAMIRAEQRELLDAQLHQELDAWDDEIDDRAIFEDDYDDTDEGGAQTIYVSENDEEYEDDKEDNEEDNDDEIDDEDNNFNEKDDYEEEEEHIYILDTNLIIECVDVIYDPDDDDWCEPLDFKPSLKNAHLVIPEIVLSELGHLKTEGSLRSMIAQIALKRLEKFIPNSGRKIEETLNLKKPVYTGYKNQRISVLPLHRNFSKILPFVPRPDDNDGWIAVTALAATLISEEILVDGTPLPTDITQRDNAKDKVVLLTNDRELRSKADNYAVRTSRFSFTPRPPFTGCRELVVPAEMFEKFYHEDMLSREDFEYYLPNERSLVANEYIVMTPEDDMYPRGYFSDNAPYKNICRYHKENDYLYPLRFMKKEGKYPPNAGIATYYDALNDDKIRIINVMGAAGTGKTYQAIIHAIKAVQEGKYRRIIVIPSSNPKNSLGALPGNEERKMDPMIAFCKDAIESFLAETPEFKKKRAQLRKYGDNEDTYSSENETETKERNKKRRQERDYRYSRGNFTGNFDNDELEDESIRPSDFNESHSRKREKAHYLGKSEKKKTDNEPKMTYEQMLQKQVDYIYNRYFISKPYDQVCGRSFRDSIVILDEFQRTKIDDADTLVTRPANDSKLIICGDNNQNHKSSPRERFQNGLNYARMLYYDTEICANVFLTENMRGVVAAVATENSGKVRRRLGLFH